MLQLPFSTSRRLSRIVQVVVLLLVILSLLIGFTEFARPARLHALGIIGLGHTTSNAGNGNSSTESGLQTSNANSSTESTPEGNPTLLALAPPYITSILNPQNSSSPILQCPSLNQERYKSLSVSSSTTPSNQPHYFFAINLRQSAKVITRLLSSIIEAIKFLGPTHCTISMVVGDSPDGTYEILLLLKPELEALGIKYRLVLSTLDTHVQDRIGTLAKLRNLALKPLIPITEHENTTVVFLNDISVCSEDILELVHQRKMQGADMTCAMDWTYAGEHPTFYDVWIARDMKGDTFFEIPPDGNWNSAWNLFWNNPSSQEKWQNNEPFQVFSCWNGMASFSADVLGKVRFRAARAGECPQGEPQLFCKDMWFNGFGKIAVVPSINVEYSDEACIKIKKLKGYVSEIVERGEGSQDVVWEKEPPKEVRCMASYEHQTWGPWNEGLEGS